MGNNTGSAKAEQHTVAEKKDKGTSEPSFDMDELQALAALVNEHGFTDFEFENENIRVRLSKHAGVPMIPPPTVQHAAGSPAPPAVSATPAEPAEPAPDVDAALH